MTCRRLVLVLWLLMPASVFAHSPQDLVRVVLESETLLQIGPLVGHYILSGIHHIFIGPDHILFLIGLLLAGSAFRRLLLIVTAFTAAHSLTLALAVLTPLVPPGWFVEPAIALSVVYVGLDNLTRGQGPDRRGWIAFAFGLLHGFGFASVLRESGLPSQGLAFALGAFNVGVELGQVAIVAVVACILGAVRWWNERVGRQVMTVGSWLVMAAGTIWFLERVMYPEW